MHCKCATQRNLKKYKQTEHKANKTSCIFCIFSCIFILEIRFPLETKNHWNKSLIVFPLPQVFWLNKQQQQQEQQQEKTHIVFPSTSVFFKTKPNEQTNKWKI